MSVYVDKEVVTTIKSGVFGARHAMAMSALKEFVDAVMDAGLGDEKLRLERTLFEGQQFYFIVENREPIEEDSE